MDPTFLSIGLGVGIGLLYKVASRAAHRVAARRGGRQFTHFVLGGVAVRLFASVILVVLVLLLTPVDVALFTTSLLAVLVLGLAHEVWWLHRHVESGTSKRSPDDGASATSSRRHYD